METLHYNRNIDDLIKTNRLEPMIKADELVRKLNALPLIAQEEQQQIIRALFGSVGENPSVTKDVPSLTMVAGVPAKVIKNIISSIPCVAR